MPSICSYLNPLSSKFHALSQFKKIAPSKRAKVIVLTALSALATLGIGTVAFFRYFVGREVKKLGKELGKEKTAQKVDNLQKQKLEQNLGETSTKPKVLPKRLESNLDIDAIEKELFQLAPNEAHKDIQLFSFFFRNRFAIFSLFAEQPFDTASLSLDRLQKEKNVATLPLITEANTQTFNNTSLSLDRLQKDGKVANPDPKVDTLSKVDLDAIETRLLSIQDLVEGCRSANEGERKELFQNIGKATCFAAKATAIYKWFESRNSELKDLFLFRPNVEWEEEGQRFLALYFGKQPPPYDKEKVKGLIQNQIPKNGFIDPSTKKQKLVSNKDIDKLIEDYWKPLESEYGQKELPTFEQMDKLSPVEYTIEMQALIEAGKADPSAVDWKKIKEGLKDQFARLLTGEYRKWVNGLIEKNEISAEIKKEISFLLT